MSRIRPGGRRPCDKHQVNTSHRCRLCKNVSFALLFGSNCDSCITSKQSDTLHNIEMLVEQKKFKKWDSRNAAAIGPPPLIWAKGVIKLDVTL